MMKPDGKKGRLTDILWLNVSVHKITLIMQIFQSKKNLPCNHPHERTRDTFLLVPLNERE